jgi:dTDP-glucose pyrophosphorylase
MNAATNPFGGIVVSDKATIRTAMQAITANAREVVLVEDGAGRIAGLITDGDIRRGLLRGLTLDSPASEVMTREFVSAAPELDRAAVLDLMKARTIRHVPVLDGKRRLVAIHFLRDLIGASPKPNVAVIMAGGQGTRLRPLTDKLPKPMVPVAGRPILERLVLHLVGHGVSRIHLAVNVMADTIERHFGDGEGFGCRIDYLRETKPLGTGGALSLLRRPVDDPVLVLNGDQITHVDVTAILASHAAGGCAATIGVGPYQVQIPFGTVADRDGRLLSIEEKPTMNFLVNRGVYVLDPSLLDEIPRDRDYPITSLFESLLEAKRPVNVFYSEDSWIDVGRPEDLHRAHGGA